MSKSWKLPEERKSPVKPTTETEKVIATMLDTIYPYDYHSHGMFGGMEYLIRKNIDQSSFRQEDAANKWHVTIVTIRNNVRKIGSKIKNLTELHDLYDEAQGKKNVPE